MPAKSSSASTGTGAGLWRAKSIAEVAGFFGRTRDLVQRDWRPHWGPECFTPDGQYDLAAIAKWVLSRPLAQGPNDLMADLNRKKKELEAAKLEQQIAQERRKNLEADGQLVDRAAVESDIKTALRSLRDMLLRIPSELIPILGDDGTVVADEIRRLFERACNEFVDRMSLHGHNVTGVVPVSLGSVPSDAAAVDVGLDHEVRPQPEREGTV